MNPPVTSTLPEGINVAVWEKRGTVANEAAGAQALVAGSYNSALGKALLPLLVPPATSTLPVDRRVALCSPRAVASVPAADHVFIAGSYSSALATAPPEPIPPVISTLPE